MLDFNKTQADALKLLDLKEDATLDELKDAYRKKAVETHPDKGGNAKTFIAVKNAYEFLVKYGTKARVASVRRESNWYNAGYTSTSTTQSVTVEDGWVTITITIF